MFFRVSAQQLAREAELWGWVRNCPDGAVEAVVEGPEEACRRFIEWCRKGPRGARVDRVDYQSQDPTHAAEAFRILYDSEPSYD